MSKDDFAVSQMRCNLGNNLVSSCSHRDGQFIDCCGTCWLRYDEVVDSSQFGRKESA